MQLVNPIWLWGLTGLLIPIAIHLLSRKEGKVIKFGSLRHLEESQSKQSINIRLNEIALLLIRCALIILIVIILCGIDTDLFHTGENKWIVIEEGLIEDRDIYGLVDSLKAQGFETRTMNKGFPATSDKSSQPFENYWEMIDQLPLGSLTDVIIVSYSYASKFKGKRIALPPKVTWLTKEPEANDFILSATKFSADSVTVRSGKSSFLLTEFTNVKEQAAVVLQSKEKMITVNHPDTIRIVIYSDPDFEYDKKIILASLKAIERTVGVVFKLTHKYTNNATKEADWNIWLSGKDPMIKNANILTLRDDGISDSPLLKKNFVSQNGQQWIITKRLNEEIALQNQLALNLSYLFAKSEVLRSRADSLDRTSQPDEFLDGEGRNTSTASLRIVDESDEQFLLMTILILLIIERILSFKRNA